MTENTPTNIPLQTTPPTGNEPFKFTFSELFAGIGGVSFGLERLGGHCNLAAEYDPTADGKRQFAQDAYKLLHPTTNVVGDVHTISGADVGPVDVFAFTPPCQAFSMSGKRLGFEDTRGTLTFEALRIAKDIAPPILFMENVKGLVSHDKGRTIETMLRAITSLGYYVDFKILNSKDFGVAQSRERIFIVAIRKDLLDQTVEGKSEEEIAALRVWKPKGALIESKAKRRLNDVEDISNFNYEWPQPREITRFLKDFLEPEVDEKFFYPHERVGNLTDMLEETQPTYTLKEKQSAICVGYSNIPANNQNRRAHSEEGLCPTITTVSGGNTHPKVAIRQADGTYRIRKLTPRECMRLQAFPEWAIDKLFENNYSNARIYKFAGNAVTSNVITAIGEGFQKYIELSRAQQENDFQSKTGTTN